MPDPETDPEAEKDMAPVLKRDERLIWAARRRKPGYMTRFGTYIWSAVFVSLSAIVIINGSYGGVILLGIMFLPGLYLGSLSPWFVTYGLTDKRFYIVCRLPPRSWETLNLVDWDTNWIRFGAGKNRIHLAYHGPAHRPGWWNKSQYRRCQADIENIPDLEAVRELLLKKIGSSERPDEETRIKKKPRKPVVSGTMTG